jgi:hypothetical protein
MRGVLRYAQNDKQKRGNDNSSDCWVGDGFTPTHRKCAMDGAPVCCGFPKRNKDNSKFLPGMTTRKTKTKAKERPEQDKRDGNINSKGALGTVRRSRPSRKRFCVLVLSWDEGEVLDGDLCADACTFPRGQEDYGDFIKSMDCCLSWDGESQYFFHRWAVQGSLSSFAGYDCSLPKIQRWISNGIGITETKAQRDCSGADVSIGNSNVDLTATSEVDHRAEILIGLHQ